MDLIEEDNEIISSAMSIHVGAMKEVLLDGLISHRMVCR